MFEDGTRCSQFNSTLLIKNDQINQSKGQILSIIQLIKYSTSDVCAPKQKKESYWSYGRGVPLSRLQQPIPDPPLPGGAEVGGRDTAQLKPALQNLVAMGDRPAVLRLQGENLLRDLEKEKWVGRHGKSQGVGRG